MISKTKHILTFALLIFILSSCTEYQKILKSSDYNLKYDKAMEYYAEEDFYRAQTLFEELVHILKGSSKGENVLYYFADCHYKLEDYILGAYFFETFAKTFPNSDRTPEATYLAAYCYYMNSPKPSLDQTDTRKAIDAMQLFINKYPGDNRIVEANEIIEELREKLEQKAYDNAKLYFKLSDFQSATIALKNSIKDFPDTKYREDILYLIVKSSYMLAEKSVTSKQGERYQNTISEYYAFVDEYPNSKHVKEIEKMYEKSVNQIKNQ